MDYLFNPDKLKYVKKDKNYSGCLLCALRDREPDVEALTLYRDDLVMATLNLYPFNPGHLLLFPSRHIERYRDMTDEEIMAMHRLLTGSLSILEERFSPAGFNLGYNLGRGSGASIAHIHQQVLPRYENELGFLEVMAGTRLMVHDPRQVLEELKDAFSHLS